MVKKQLIKHEPPTGTSLLVNSVFLTSRNLNVSGTVKLCCVSIKYKLSYKTYLL